MKWKECEAALERILRDHDIPVDGIADDIASFINEHWGLEPDEVKA